MLADAVFTRIAMA